MKFADQNQALTRETYEDPLFVQAYLNKNGSSDSPAYIHAFAKLMQGKRLIDIGCGPGIDSRRFAEIGFQVTGIDYSGAMVEAAKTLSPGGNPTYLQLDMREIGDIFDPNEFDAAWVSASLIHVPEHEVPTVLQGIHKVLTQNGIVRFTLKGGLQGATLVHDEKYGLPIERDFIFWEEVNFSRVLITAGFIIDSVETDQHGVTGTEPTNWLIFTARANKI
jgi:SAM-dependent methyltransferase